MTVDDDRRLRGIDVDELIDRSSLGAEDVREMRERTPPEVRRRLVASLVRPAAPGRGEPPAAPVGRMPAPFFFLSYAAESDAAPGSGAGSDLRGFFRLLSLYLSQISPRIAADERTGRSGLVPGYLVDDRGDGTPRLRPLHALSSCRVFVPVLSRAYLDSARCRRELETFRRRDEIRRRLRPCHVPAVVPVLWDRPGRLDLPGWVADLHPADAALGAEYLRNGIAALQTGDPAVYRSAVYQLARLINDVGELIPADDPGEDRGAH